MVRTIRLVGFCRAGVGPQQWVADQAGGCGALLRASTADRGAWTVGSVRCRALGCAGSGPRAAALRSGTGLDKDVAVQAPDAARYAVPRRRGGFAPRTPVPAPTRGRGPRPTTRPAG